MSKVIPVHVPVVEVTPDMAQEWLDTRLPNERLLRLGRAEGMARDMRDGRWYFTGDPLRFDDGHLVDGQHRLRAVVLSGTTQHFTVVNVPAEAQHVIDTGAKRTVIDTVRKRGMVTSGHLSKQVGAIANKASAWELGFVGSRGTYRPTADESLIYIERNLKLLIAAADVAILAAKNRLPVAVSSIGTLWYLTHSIDAGQADEFWVEQVIKGIGLSENDPALVYQNRLRKEAHSGRRMAPDDALLYGAIAWNHYRSRNKIEKLQQPRGGFSNRAISLK